MTDYNFFEVYEKKKGIKIDSKSPFFWGIIVVAIILLATAGSIGRNVFLTMQIASLESRTEVLQQSEDYAAANELQESLDAMLEYDTQAAIALQTFENSQLIDSELIKGIIAKIPNNATVVSFGLEDYEFGITCYVPTRKAAAEVLLRLKETGLFETLYLSSVAYDEDERTFAVAIDGVLKVGDQHE